MSIVTGFNTILEGIILDIGQVFVPKISGSAITTNMTAKNGLGDIGNLFQAYSPYLSTPLFNSIYTVTILGIKYDLSQIFKCYPIIILNANGSIVTPTPSITDVSYNIQMEYTNNNPATFMFMYPYSISGYLVGGGGGGAPGSTNTTDKKGGGGGGGGEVYNILGQSIITNVNFISITAGNGGNYIISSDGGSTKFSINNTIIYSAGGGLNAIGNKGGKGGGTGGGAGGTSNNGGTGLNGTTNSITYGGGGGGEGYDPNSGTADAGGGGGGGVAVNYLNNNFSTGFGGPKSNSSSGALGGANNGGNGGNNENPGNYGNYGGGGGGGGSSTSTAHSGGVGGPGFVYLTNITFNLPKQP